MYISGPQTTQHAFALDAAPLRFAAQVKRRPLGGLPGAAQVTPAQRPTNEDTWGQHVSRARQRGRASRGRGCTGSGVGRPTLRQADAHPGAFYYLVRLAGVAVGQVGLPSGGGWARLTLAVGRHVRIPKNLFEVPN